MAKICIVSPSLKLGGIERALTTLANEFQAMGHEVHFITCLKDDHFYKLTEGVKIIEPSFKRTASKINKLFFYPKLLKFIRTNVIFLNPDRILVYGDWFSPITLLALYGIKLQVYISDRTIPNYKFSFPIPQLKKWLYPKSSGFIAQTQRAKEYKIKQFGDKFNIKVIPNALPTLHQESVKNVSQDSKKILYVGRFEWEKDPEILIRAFKEVVITHPDWILEMAGDGPLYEKMKFLAQELNLNNSIVFHGKVKDIAKLYSNASIFVLPSVIEGFPNALIEAMYFGLPCICFSDIPYEDIVEDQTNGIVVKERTLLLLAGTIQTLINQPNIRAEIGNQAMNSINSKCNPQQIALEILKFMNLLSDNKKE